MRDHLTLSLMASRTMDLSNAKEDGDDYDEISMLESLAFDVGDYTSNGWLTGKKLRILPVGSTYPSCNDCLYDIFKWILTGVGV